ncbi:uncharacterized protein BXZ73DRAFT_80735 [Epithele typhae]|uniref:uncharacterized protein n=1 Tax=Epithele typhae TaxID=378194 RepID=UPI002007D4D3|nr:uncharacterized protein BXZ73DRAFT_80735 [Epithele typhae]KAH9917895.1 hypothetical protein BXZ73DRAFT_80735 [Epithele typhae]
MEVLRLTGGKGVDVIYDPVGLIRCFLKCIALKGYATIMGFAAGQIEKRPNKLHAFRWVGGNHSSKSGICSLVLWRRSYKTPPPNATNLSRSSRGLTEASIDAKGGNVEQYLRKVVRAIGELDDKEKQHRDVFTVADQHKCIYAQPDFDANGMGNVRLRAFQCEFSLAVSSIALNTVLNGYSPSNLSSSATHSAMLPCPPRTSPAPSSPTEEEGVTMERSPTELSTEAVTALLEDLAKLVEQRFLCLGEDEDELGPWSVESIAHTRLSSTHMQGIKSGRYAVGTCGSGMSKKVPGATRSEEGRNPRALVVENLHSQIERSA